MHSLRPAKKLLPGVLWLVTAAVGSSQEALRTAIELDKSTSERSLGLPEEAEQVRAGPVNFALGLSYALELNDNIRNTEARQTSDIIHRPNLHVQAVWPATRSSVISLKTGIGGVLYTEHSELDRFTVTPESASELAWDIPIRDFLLTLYDRFNYRQSVIDEGALSGTADYPRFNNAIGLRGNWQPNAILYQAGYSHNNLIAMSDRFNYQNSSSEQIFARAGYHFARATQVGLETSAGWTTYDQPIQNNSKNVSAGPFIESQFTDALRASLRAGSVFCTFEPAGNRPTPGDLLSYYAGAELLHRITHALSHGLEARHEVRPGILQGSPYVEETVVDYHIDWAATRNGSFQWHYLFEDGTQPRFPVKEHYQRYGTGLTYTYQLTRKINTMVNYRYTLRDSDLEGRNYRVNQLIFTARYQY